MKKRESNSECALHMYQKTCKTRTYVEHCVHEEYMGVSPAD